MNSSILNKILTGMRGEGAPTIGKGLIYSRTMSDKMIIGLGLFPRVRKKILYSISTLPSVLEKSLRQNNIKMKMTLGI